MRKSIVLSVAIAAAVPLFAAKEPPASPGRVTPFANGERDFLKNDVP